MDNFKYVLASNSPRRKELLAGLGWDFEVRVIDGIDESKVSAEFKDGVLKIDLPKQNKTEVSRQIAIK